MEILALIGTPKVVAERYSSGYGGGLFNMSVVTNVFNTDINQPGAMFNSAAGMDGSGYFQYAFGLTFPAGALSLKDDTFDRSVIGFRVVTKGGYKGETSTTPMLYAIATVKPSTGNNQIGTSIPYAPHLNGDEGQYYEIVIDWKTGTFWIYVDGGFVSSMKFTAPQGIDNAYPLIFRLYADHVNMPYSNSTVIGHVRDLYLGSLAVGEVFDPLGTLRVDQLLTTSHTLNFNITPDIMNTWANLFTVNTTLDTAGTKLYTQNFADPTPLKTADYVTAIAPSVTLTGYVEASSNGAKIADNVKPRLLPNVRVLKINPANIGNDLTMSFKIDP